MGGDCTKCGKRQREAPVLVMHQSRAICHVHKHTSSTSGLVIGRKPDPFDSWTTQDLIKQLLDVFIGNQFDRPLHAGNGSLQRTLSESISRDLACVNQKHNRNSAESSMSANVPSPAGFDHSASAIPLR